MMKLKHLGERWTLRLIIITPLAALAILTVVITSFYIDKMNFYFKVNAERYLSEYIASQKSQGEVYVKDIDHLASFILANLETNIQKELDERLKLASQTANSIYEKYHKRLPKRAVQERIIDALSAMRWNDTSNYIFITDYEGNNIVTGSQDLRSRNLSGWTDADGRAVVLEEIQMVRKYGEGYIKTRFRKETGVQTMKVKDFGHYGWFFGSGIHHDHAMKKTREGLLKLIKEAPRDRSGYMAIFEGKKPIFISEKESKEHSKTVLELIQKYLTLEDGWVALPEENAHVYIHHFEPFDWHIVYGFKKAYFSSMLKEQQEKMRNEFEHEVQFVIEASIVIALLVGILTFIVSRRIIAIIEEYKEELDLQETELRELNASLEARVTEEVNARREKEKMLIQQSKMAAMGDMLSMIAHQWRQPLNQMSYVLMNIESAYEFKEMTPKYMQEKVNEGTRLLEYMSHTIDDFKNYFKPDKERSDEQISKVIEDTVSLVQKSLEAHNITLKMRLESDTHLMVYRNELLQVILNLITNAKDALVIGTVSVPQIEIVLKEEGEKLYLSICDNGGGIDEEIKEKIFEPYFSTKGAHSGTGLGLYMSKTIVEEHLNGSIVVTNINGGACFTVILM